MGISLTRDYYIGSSTQVNILSPITTLIQTKYLHTIAINNVLMYKNDYPCVAKLKGGNIEGYVATTDSIVNYNQTTSIHFNLPSYPLAVCAYDSYDKRKLFQYPTGVCFVPILFTNYSTRVTLVKIIELIRDLDVRPHWKVLQTGG